MITKKEFRGAITKLVTKKEFGEAMKKIDNRFESIDQSLSDGDKNFRLINARFNYLESVVEDIKANMYTKQDHARDLVWMDKAMTEMDAAREERLLREPQLLRIDDQVHDHEKRIRVLEKR